MRLLPYALVLCLFAPKALAEEVPCPPDLAPMHGEVIQQLAGNAFAGAYVLITKDGETLWSQGFGYADLERQDKPTADTPFLLASTTKPIAATGLMMLADKGQLDIDQPVNAYLPGPKLRAHVGSASGITVRRVLQHSAGLPTYYQFYYHAGTRPDMDESIRRWGYATRLPGEAWHYSNFGYGLADYLTEVVSGQAWPDYLADELFAPLGMRNSSARYWGEDLPNKATLYTKDLAGRFVAVGAYDFDHRGASGAWSSARDLTRFLHMHINGGELDGVRILEEATAREMHQQIDVPGAEYGLGFVARTRRGERMINHGGAMPGCRVLMVAWPDIALTLVVLTNADSTNLPTPLLEMAERTFILDEDVPRGRNGGARERPARGQFAGEWHGVLEHFQGDIPLKVAVDAAGDVRAQMGGGPMRRVEQARASKDLSFKMTGPLFIQESYHGLTELDFTFELADGNLQGEVTATAPGYFHVTLWAELKPADAPANP